MQQYLFHSVVAEGMLTMSEETFHLPTFPYYCINKRADERMLFSKFRDVLYQLLQYQQLVHTNWHYIPVFLFTEQKWTGWDLNPRPPHSLFPANLHITTIYYPLRSGASLRDTIQSTQIPGTATFLKR